MRIICVMHADFETPGVIQLWAESRGHAFEVVKPYLGERFPTSGAFDAFISMGGPQSSLDFEEYSYLAAEVVFLKQVLQRDVPVIGFCLGAQLIGLALGASPSRSPEREFGIFPVMLTGAGREDPLLGEFGDSFPVIHWHGDMAGETEDSVLLAYSDGCPRQAIRYRKRVYGLQFHMEITRKGLRDLVGSAPQDLTTGEYVQSVETLLATDTSSINEKAMMLLDRWLSD